VQVLSELDVEIHPITQKTLDLFVEKVKEHQGDNLSKIILFGSVARGEADEYSDIDVLVILKNRNSKERFEISDISVDVERYMKYDDNAYLQTLTISEEESMGLDFYTLMFYVNKEGVILYDGVKHWR